MAMQMAQNHVHRAVLGPTILRFDSMRALKYSKGVHTRPDSTTFQNPSLVVLAVGEERLTYLSKQ